MDLHGTNPFFSSQVPTCRRPSPSWAWATSCAWRAAIRGEAQKPVVMVKNMVIGWDFYWDLPSGNVKIAIENGHRNSEFSH